MIPYLHLSSLSSRPARPLPRINESLLRNWDILWF
ncbi:hypothetical protein FG05_35319 [Fusarium graminearum]|nr:hypothetical protein FG05_35319 [Fusarium graminearum]